MTELRKELEEAFKLISAVPVNGGNVDVMAEARERLRRAYQMASEAEKGEEVHGG